MDNIKAISAYLALGQETRLDVFRLIVRARGGARFDILPSEIIEALGIPNATLSFHLKGVSRRWTFNRRASRSKHGLLP
jgi:predicted transcriptional regulator